MSYPPDPTDLRGGPVEADFIPDLWEKQLLHDQLHQGFFASHLPPGPPRPPLPLRKRLRIKLHTQQWNFRDSLALKIAPWLKPEDRW